MLSSRFQRRAYSVQSVFVLGVILFLAGGALILPRLSQAALQSTGSESAKAKSPKPVFIPGEILVRFRKQAVQAKSTIKGNTSAEFSVEDSGRSISIQVERLDSGVEVIEGLRLARVNPEDTEAAIQSLRARADVIYAEPNYVRYSFATPNDPMYADLWALHNTATIFGSSSNTGLLLGADIDAEKAWSITTGSRDVVVGVVDEGIDVNHPDLRSNVWKNPGEVAGNGLDDDGNALVDDINGFDFFHNRGSVFDSSTPQADVHGTHVAGTIGAEGNNGLGVVGVNWQVGLMSLKILGPESERPYPSNVGLLVRAYSYAKKMRDLWVSSGGTKGANIRVLNNSIGGYGRSQAELESIRALNDSGILFVAAAGNYTRNNDVFPIYPAGYESPNVISVAASSFRDQLAGFSNVGARTVSLSAPGVTILSTTPYGNYAALQGTSMASPHVAGAAALICAAHPSISVERLKSALIYNGDLISSQDYKTLTGGRLNVFHALNAAAENDMTPPSDLSDLRVIAQRERTLTLGWTAPGDDGMIGSASLYDIRFSDHDLSTPENFELATPISPLGIPRPATAGDSEGATVDVPFQNTTGFIGVRATDNLGNKSSVAVVPVIVDSSYAGFYDVNESAPQQLSTGGKATAPIGDDRIFPDYPLPFSFPFFGQWVDHVMISTNGALYFSTPPKFLLPPLTGRGESLDASSSVRALQTNRMIAGMWDDVIVTNMWVSNPDPNRIIFRWEGTTFDTPFDDGTSRGQGPVNFEMELRSDGTIQVRYGQGNKKLLPVVGISGGSPDAYVVNSHTSENAFLDLTNAHTVTFTPRFRPAPPAADLQIIVMRQSVQSGPGDDGILLPAAVVPGQFLQYSFQINDLGPDAADNVTFTSQLPAGTSFIQCLGMQCVGPAPGTDGGTVTASFGRIGDVYYNRLTGGTIQVKVNAVAGTTLTSTFAVSSSTPDRFQANNATTATTLVADYSLFNNVVDVRGNRLTTLALRQDGTVWFWGIPFGAPESSVNAVTTPMQVAGLSNITAIAAGGEHGLALKSDGTVWSWGLNEVGQLGNQQIDGPFTPFPPSQIPELNDIATIAAGGGSSYAVSTDGTVWAWGDDPVTFMPQPHPVRLSTISGVRSVSTSGSTSYAIKHDGTLWSWGSNFAGALGDGSTVESSVIPVRVSGLTDVRSVASRFNHTLAVKNDGTVWTWGRGSAGELGDGRTNDSDFKSNVPLLVNNLTNVVAVGAGDVTCLVLKGDGTVWIWGNSQPFPAQVAGLGGVKSISAWTAQYAAIMADSTVQMWGFNSYGGLGNGTFAGGTSLSPVIWLGVVATPIFNPGDNTYLSFNPGFTPADNTQFFPREVTVSCDTPGAVIHYTTSGADPTETDPTIISGGRVRIDHSSVLKAKAWKSGWSPSKVRIGSYTIGVTPEGQAVFLTEQQITQIKAWTVGGRTYVYVKPQFPDAGYRVANWGQVGGSGNDFTVDASVERFPGPSIQSVVTTAQIYDLGPLPEGTYNFNFKTSGTLAKMLQFTVSSATPPANPIDNAREFVRQQYKDFLSREPDGPGWDHWTGETTQCTTDPSKRFPGESEAQCIVRKRANTSAAFFLSPEFQNTGYFVLRVYLGSLNRMPFFGGSVPADNARDEFTRESAAVSAGIVVNNELDPAVINANKQAFVNEFVTRQEFLEVYGSLNNTEYVDKLFLTTRITPTSTERTALINGLTNSSETRASVLFKIVDGTQTVAGGALVFQTPYGQAFYDQQFNPAFVQMEYFGYMKRDPDDAGYAFWLGKLNLFGNWVDAQMVMAFISSPEYRARFGQP